MLFRYKRIDPKPTTGSPFPQTGIWGTVFGEKTNTQECKTMQTKRKRHSNLGEGS